VREHLKNKRHIARIEPRRSGHVTTRRPTERLFNKTSFRAIPEVIINKQKENTVVMTIRKHSAVAAAWGWLSAGQEGELIKKKAATARVLSELRAQK